MKTKKTSVISVILAFVLVSVMAVGVLASAAVPLEVVTPQIENPIEVYNGDTKINLINQPFIENGDYYLPLRETLNAFGISDISWTHEQIQISFLGNKRSDGSIIYKYFIIKNDYILFLDGYFTNDKMTNLKGQQHRENLRNAPIVKDGVTYISLDFFEYMIEKKYMPNFKINHVQSSDPKDYYKQGEEVFIGTKEQHHVYKPTNLVKRIVVNEDNEVIAVIPIENQTPEVVQTITSKVYTRFIPANFTPYDRIFTSWTSTVNSNGETVVLSIEMLVRMPVYELDGSVSYEVVAYIPPAYQINRFNLNK